MLMLSIVFFVSAFFVSKLFNQYNSPQSVTSRLNSGIALAFNDLEKEIEKIEATRFNNQADFLKYLDKNYKTAFENEGIVILIYEHDSLRYWSDNVVAAPRVLQNKNEFPKLIITKKVINGKEYIFGWFHKFSDIQALFSGFFRFATP